MMKEQKGITLVALVITIIVMLILAGVTISIIVNGGLFNQAENAVTQTEVKSLEEAVKLALAEYVTESYATNPTATPAPIGATKLEGLINNYYKLGSGDTVTAGDVGETDSGDLAEGFIEVKSGKTTLYVKADTFTIVSKTEATVS